MFHGLRKYFWAVLFAVCLCPRPAWADAMLTVVPSTSTPSVGGSFSADINIAGVSDLAGFQFDLTFAPGILAATSVSEGAFASASTTGFSPGTTDNTTGNITLVFDALFPSVGPSGTLVTVDFTALAAGTSAITLGNVILSDSFGNSLPFSATPGEVTISGAVTGGGGGTGVPEPGTLLLLGVGAIAIGVGALRRRQLA